MSSRRKSHDAESAMPPVRSPISPEFQDATLLRGNDVELYE
ncbi:hypothetical protein [Azospirillum melinis]